jgi:heme/copper-type cytochrome/quinol oxidase subunit 2
MTTFLAKASEHAIELPFPAFFFGVIAMGVFLLMAWVTWSYRDVANRRANKSTNSKAHH